MTHWLRRIDIKDAWKQGKAGEITVTAIARIIAAKLKELPEYYLAKDDELEDITFRFGDLPDDADIDEFDDIMDRLYNWGDTILDSSGPFSTWTKQCWIATF